MNERIVSIHQPHARPIVRGKARSKTEFGAKIHLSLVDGYSFLDTISWDAFNEGSCLKAYVENYRQRFGFYPAKVLADKIYCSQENRKWLKDNGIKLAAKPLGRPSAKAVENHVSPGDRNPIEGKFSQAKTGYGMNRIKARLKDTSQSWIAAIILVLNLVKLAGEALLCLGFSAWATLNYALILIQRINSQPLKAKIQFRLNSGLDLRI
jgi:transposase, IS5 family